MQNNQQISGETKSLLDFIKSLPSAKNVRVYTSDQASNLDLRNEGAAVRRSVIRQRNS
jgi:hypothetical protein